MTHTKLRTSVFRLANKGWQNGEKSNRLSKKKKKELEWRYGNIAGKHTYCVLGRFATYL